MSGLYGYFDPNSELPAGTITEMGSVMGCPSDRIHRFFQEAIVAVGCVGKAVYAGECELLISDDGARRGFHAGRLTSSDDGATDNCANDRARRILVESAGDELLRAANGPFAAAVWDERENSLELTTDRYGMYPLYVAQIGGATLFSTQLKALLLPSRPAPTFDPVAVALMVGIGELVGSVTPLAGIRAMPAGTRRTIGANGEESRKYWSFSFEETDSAADSTCEQLATDIRLAVSRACIAAPSVGVPLSGGLDSRLLLAATPNPSAVPSFTWGVRGCRDLRYARQIADNLGSTHHAFEYEGDYLAQVAPLGVWITEGQLPCTDMHVLPYVEHVAKHCRMILNGFAGDVVLGGNFTKKPWWKAANRTAAGDALWRWRDGRVAEPYRRAMFGSAQNGCGLQAARDAFLAAFQESPGDTPMSTANAFLFDNRVRRFTSCGTSLMRWHVESESPFFDNDLFDRAARLPSSWRYRHRGYRNLMRRFFPKACKARWQRTGLRPDAPAILFYSSLALHKLDRIELFHPLFRGRAVAHMADWLRGPLRTYVKGILQSDRTSDRGALQPDAVRRVLNDHFSCKRDNTGLIGSLLAIENCARLFIDRDRELVERCKVAPPAPERIERSPLSIRPSKTIHG